MTRAATAQTIKSAAKPPVRISRFFLRRHKITCPQGFLYAKLPYGETDCKKAAISIPLARFSGIGIAVWDPMWYAGQEENWKIRGLGKEWAA